MRRASHLKGETPFVLEPESEGFREGKRLPRQSSRAAKEFFDCSPACIEIIFIKRSSPAQGTQTLRVRARLAYWLSTGKNERHIPLAPGAWHAEPTAMRVPAPQRFRKPIGVVTLLQQSACVLDQSVKFL